MISLGSSSLETGAITVMPTKQTTTELGAQKRGLLMSAIKHALIEFVDNYPKEIENVLRNTGTVDLKLYPFGQRFGVAFLEGPQ